MILHKNINYKRAIILLIAPLLFISCLLDDEEVDFGDGPNLVGFADDAQTVTIIANGNTNSLNVPITIIGPSKPEIDEPISATVEVDPSSTAIENVHYQLPTSSVQISKESEFVGELPLIILSEGIMAPLAEAPVLKLRVVGSNSMDNLVINNKTDLTEIKLTYVSEQNLAGTYEVLESTYFRIGVKSSLNWVGEERVIESVNESTYFIVDHVGPFDDDDNDVYFTVSDDNIVTVQTMNPTDNSIILLNNNPVNTCGNNPDRLTNVPCSSSETNLVERVDDRRDIIRITHGYQAGSGPREFYEVLRRKE